MFLLRLSASIKVHIFRSHLLLGHTLFVVHAAVVVVMFILLLLYHFVIFSFFVVPIIFAGLVAVAVLQVFLLLPLYFS